VDAAHWGGMRHHVFYGALYHWFVMFRNGEYRKFQRHRELPLVAETALYTRRLMLMPFIALDRIISTFRIKHGGYPYHIALLQLEHDSSFQMHSPFDRMEDFLALVIEGFAKGAPKHHHLVFKAQP
jgi:capsular polysaccharide export protein